MYFSIKKDYLFKGIHDFVKESKSKHTYTFSDRSDVPHVR